MNQNKEFECHGFKCCIEELEDGYRIDIKGDKEKIKAKVEFIEAFLNYREKAKAAGVEIHPHKSHGGHFLGHLHQHLKTMHKRKHHSCKQD